MNESTILRTVPAANELHKVPGFDPMKYLRRAVNDKGEPVMRLELRYQRLWFRLAYPKGRMLLNPLRVTDQLAIFEAKVFFRQDDTTPASSFTANKTVRETPGYIQAAQNEALKVALDNAGFGIQLCDVTQEPENGLPVQPIQVSGGESKAPAQPYVQTEQPQKREAPAGHVLEEGRTAPAPAPVPPVQTMETPAAEEPAPAPVPVTQTTPVTEPVPPAQPEKVEAPAEAAAPTAQTVSTDPPAPADEPIEEEPAPAPVPEPESTTAQTEQAEKLDTDPHEETTAANGQQSSLLTVLNFPKQAEETPVLQEADPAAELSAPAASGQEETPAQAAPSYTDDMPVEEICQVMTMEEAGAIIVPRGPCMGWTMAQVAERRPSSLRFFLTKFSECSNSQKAAATLLMQDLEQKKAG